MSAPEANALPPAPVTTITRTDASALKSAIASSAASHISSEIAFSFSGLLKLIQPMPSAFFTISFSLAIAASSDDSFALQPRDAGVVEADLAQDLGGVLAERRRMRDDPARRAAERHRLAEVRHVADLLHDAELAHLRVRERLVDRIDRAARHAGRVERIDPVGGAARSQVPLDVAVQAVAVLGAQRRGLVVGVLGEPGRADRVAQAQPDLAAGSGDVHVAVAGAKDAGRDRRRMVVARLLRDLALHQPARRLEVEHEELC